MKKYVWLIGLLLGFPALGNTSFEWYEGNDWALSRINIFDKTYEFRALNGTWVKKFDLIFEGIDSREMPISASPLASAFMKQSCFQFLELARFINLRKTKKPLEG
jgi:hypothetical protein